MIQFTREKEVIKIDVTNAIGWNVEVEIKPPGEMYAVLLHQSIQEKMGNELERIRREAYEQGWNDHKKRKPKADWFKRWW